MLEKIVQKGNNLITYIFYTIAIIICIISLFFVYENIYDLNNAFSDSTINKYKPVIIDDGKKPLSSYTAPEELGPDYRAWLTLDDTFIDYPLMQGKDDLYYAAHNAFGESALTGITYLASANSPDFSDNYNLIYGHHMDNSAMFGGLDKFKDKGYFDSHKTGTIIVGKKVYDVHIFAVMNTNAYDGNIYHAGNRNIEEILKYIKAKNIHFEEGIADGSSKIVVFSTCADGSTDGRLAVFGIMTLNKNKKVTPPSGGSGKKISDGKAPLGWFTPRGNTYRDSWALINLICLILTCYLTLPVNHLKAKFRRIKMLDEVIEEKNVLYFGPTTELGTRIRDFIESFIEDRPILQEIYEKTVKKLYGNPDKFRRKVKVGFVLEIIVAAIAFIVFILTEDIRLPMVPIDEWTLLMALFLLAVWLFDVWMRKKKNKYVEEED